MSKYQFFRMGGDAFEQMAQALLEKRRRGFGSLIQFGTGPDGSREATWTQPPDHPDYIRPVTATSNVPKKWVFQVKFHDIGQRGWRGAGEAVIGDLKNELVKLTTKHAVPCDHYVLITNVPLSGARWIGTRDQITKVTIDWKDDIPEIEVWDAVDLSRLLDNNADVRVGYEELILPGDALAAIYRQVQFQADRREHTFRGYLRYVVDNESKARADEAGDEDQLPLSKIFVDQTLRLDRDRVPECYTDAVASWSMERASQTTTPHVVPTDLDSLPSSFVLLLGAHDKVMLLAGPGSGKSTITQFLALYHASRLVRPDYATRLATRLKLPPNISPGCLDSFCQMRFPFRVELRRYAKWRKGTSTEDGRKGLATYIARELIGKNVESRLSEDDIFELANRNPVLLILDGLDEVPNKESRDDILKDCEAFIYRCSGEQADIQIVMSSRPQGYNGEFDRFEPLRWRINDLSESDFSEYCGAWLSERIKSAEDRAEAEERIKRGMQSDAVKRLATTLLQATVMLTIVRRKSDIPEERHKLFEKYVEVVFQREKGKNELISRYEPELRRLHEIVGYRIHEAIGRGDDGKIPEPRFREYVREVWHLLRGDQPFAGIPNQECNNIVQLATDRLVFLSGKGEEQTDIDFVIQPYREYFAAQYLNLHTEACPDKVFECLVERGPFWQNVLQFYVALSPPAQQMAWVQCAAVKSGVNSSVEDLLRGVEYQRATLATLPEYVRFSLPQLRRSIMVALPQQTWWMWIGQEWAVAIIRVLKSGEAWRELLKEFQQAGFNAPEKVAFALWLFPKAIPRDAPERRVLADLVELLLSCPEHAKVAVTVTLVYDLPVSLKDVDDRALIDAIEAYPVERHLRSTVRADELLSRLPRSAALLLLCSSSFHYRHMLGTNIWKFLGLPVESPDRDVEDLLAEEEAQVSVVAPSWATNWLSAQPPLHFETGVPHHIVEQYCMALFDALQHPDDGELHLIARRLEKILPRPAGWHLCPSFVLGPAPSEFRSDEDWCQYKRGVRELFQNDAAVAEVRSLLITLQKCSKTNEAPWCVLLFHPDDWGLLIANSLISEKELARIREFTWASLAKIPTDFLDVADYAEDFRLGERSYALPLVSIMKVAMAVHNEGRLRESSFLRSVAGRADFVGIPPDELRGIVEDIRNPSLIPEVWGELLMTMCILALPSEKQLVLRLWAALNYSEWRHLWSFRPQLSLQQELLLNWFRDLLNLGDPASLHLAFELAFLGRELPEKETSVLNERLASALAQTESFSKDQRNLLNGLLNTPPTLAEAALYSNPQWFCAVSSVVPYFGTRVAERIEIMPQTIARGHYEELARCLKPLLDRGMGYSVEVSAAALNALIQIDLANREPIREDFWQLAVLDHP